MRQFIHLPRGTGSYTVAENLAKHVEKIGPIWAMGDTTSGLYLDGVHAIRTLPSTKKRLLGELTEPEFREYSALVAKAVNKVVNPDELVLAHHGILLAPILAETSKVITHLHGSELLTLQEGGLSPYAEANLREGIQKSELVLAMSDLQKTEAERVFSNELQREVAVMGGGVDPTIFHPRDNRGTMCTKYGLDPQKKLVLYGGKLGPEKQIHLLIEAFADKPFAKNKQLVIVGGGDLKGTLEQQALEQNVAATFIPHQPQPELARLMAAADVFVLASSYESFGLVSIEALACGTPVVASNVGVLEKIVDPPKGGTIFTLEDNSTGTVQNLAAAIDQELASKRDMQDYTRHITQTLSWQRISRKFDRAVTPLEARMQ